MATREVISALQALFRESNSVEWTSSDVLQLRLGRATPFRELRELEAGRLFARFKDELAQREFDRGGEGTAAAGTVVEFTVPRTIQDIVVVPNLAALLAISGAQVREPAGYIVTELRTDGGVFARVSDENLVNGPNAIQRYHDAIRFWRILSEQAQHEDETTGALLFFGIRRTEILPGFGENELVEPSLIREIEAFISDPDRKDTRKQIFAAVLSEFLSNVNSGAAFRALLRDSARFARHLREGMAIYLSEHSPEKLAEEARAAALGISEKLEKVVSNLETKSLSIPLAVFLAVKEVAPGEAFTVVNSVVALSALIYAVTMTLVHVSQLSLLMVLRTTVETRWPNFTARASTKTTRY